TGRCNTCQRGDAAGDRTLIRAVTHHPMSTHVLPNVSASIAPGPAALAPYHPPREAVIDPVYTPRVDSVHTCVTLEAKEKPQRGWHHLRRDTSEATAHVPAILYPYRPIVNPSCREITTCVVPLPHCLHHTGVDA